MAVALPQFLGTRRAQRYCFTGSRLFSRLNGDLRPRLTLLSIVGEAALHNAPVAQPFSYRFDLFFL